MVVGKQDSPHLAGEEMEAQQLNDFSHPSSSLEQGLELGLLAPELKMALNFLNLVAQNISTKFHLIDFHKLLFI